METVVQIEEAGGWRVATADGVTVGYIDPIHDGVMVNGLHSGILDDIAPGPYPSLTEAMHAIGTHIDGACSLDGSIAISAATSERDDRT